jgi:hypothetical protein
MLSNEILNKINSVNEKIKAHNKKADEQKALRKIRLEQLIEKSNAFKEAYGVDIFNKDISKMQKEVDKLLVAEEKKVEESLAKAEKLLELVETGNYAQLNKELGIDVKEEEQEELKKVEEASEFELEEVVPTKEKTNNLLDLVEELPDDKPTPIESNEAVKEEIKDFNLDDFFDFDI